MECNTKPGFKRPIKLKQTEQGNKNNWSSSLNDVVASIMELIPHFQLFNLDALLTYFVANYHRNVAFAFLPMKMEVNYVNFLAITISTVCA